MPLRARSYPRLNRADGGADIPGVTVDDRFRDYWRHERAMRARARRLLPAKWLADPRPEMQEVCDLYAELVARELSRRSDPASRRAAT